LRVFDACSFSSIPFCTPFSGPPASASALCGKIDRLLSRNPFSLEILRSVMFPSSLRINVLIAQAFPFFFHTFLPRPPSRREVAPRFTRNSLFPPVSTEFGPNNHGEPFLFSSVGSGPARWSLPAHCRPPSCSRACTTVAGCVLRRSGGYLSRFFFFGPPSPSFSSIQRRSLPCGTLFGGDRPRYPEHVRE